MLSVSCVSHVWQKPPAVCIVLLFLCGSLWSEQIFDAPRCAICVFQAPAKAEKKEAAKEEEKPKADGVKTGL